MKSRTRMFFLIGLLVVTLAPAAMADITWKWSFNSETGYFLTNGSLVEGSAPTGIYEIADFCVFGSATGGAVGSISDGQYVSGAYSTDEPYTFSWNGSLVDQWLHSGNNSFDWHTYGNTDSSLAYDSFFFGYASGNVNDPSSAAHYVNATELSVGTVTVEVAEFDLSACVEQLELEPTPVPSLNATGTTILALMFAMFGLYFRRFS